MTPVNQFSDTIFRAFSDHFDRAFAPVPDPSVNAQMFRVVASTFSEPYALHSPFNKEPHSDVVHSHPLNENQ